MKKDIQRTAEELMLIYQNNSPEQAYEAFEELYQRFSLRVYNYLNRKTKNAADSEDLLQKVFFKIHESKHLYQEKYSFEQWLFVISRSALLDHFRSRGRYDQKLNLYAQAQQVNAQPAQEQAELELGFMEQLPDDQRQMLSMKFIDELSYQQMSAVLKKSEVSLRKSVSRLLGKLKKGEVYE